ncbi:YiiX/YebB-like N1pC/P60 family cysteine hydrolase [Helicobacter sp. 23-1048]
MRVGEPFHTYKKLAIVFAIALIACLCVFGIVFKPNQSTKRTPADIEPIALKISQNAEVGDLIFRKGLNTESDIITYISHSPFSHIGMIVSLEPLSVIHATTDDDKNAPNQVIISSLENFLSQAQAVGLRRLDLPQEIRTAMARDSLRYLAKPFVLSTDSTRFYCTTFLLEVISQQTEFEVDFINVDFAFLGGEYLFPSAFWNHQKTLKVLEVSEF